MHTEKKDLIAHLQPFCGHYSAAGTALHLFRPFNDVACRDQRIPDIGGREVSVWIVSGDVFMTVPVALSVSFIAST